MKRTEEGYLGSVSVSNSISGLDSWVMLSWAAFDFMDLSEARNSSRYLGMGELLRLCQASVDSAYSQEMDSKQVLFLFLLSGHREGLWVGL